MTNKTTSFANDLAIRVAYIYPNNYRIVEYASRETEQVQSASDLLPLGGLTDDQIADLAWETDTTELNRTLYHKPARAIFCGDRSDYEARLAADETWAAAFLADLVKDWE